MKIKTLAEILAESDADSASSTANKPKKNLKHTYKDKPKKTDNRSAIFNEKFSTTTDVESGNLESADLANNALINSTSTDDTSFDSTSVTAKKSSKTKKRKKRFHPAGNFIPEPSDTPVYQPPEAQSIKEMLAEVKSNVHGNNSSDTNNAHDANNASNSDIVSDSDDALSETDNLPAALKAYLRTPEQRQAEVDAIKAESRLRWLAFYYLSRREYGKSELKQKLIDKEQDPEKIDALLDEFEEKGYQSDYRTTLMLIRENIRKGRGRGRIKQEFYRKKIAMPSNIDELIDMANAESDEFSEFVDASEDTMVDGVDWLKLAVTARTKKYGDDIPTEQKDKARQLRFLQYRGFNTDICFAALNYTLDTVDERF